VRLGWNFFVHAGVAESCSDRSLSYGGDPMNGIIYLIGLIVVIMAILSFFGLR
jgi:hypothetical protein